VWGSEDHTNSLVPLFAKGAGASALAARADSVDPVRGQYLDNTEVAQTVLTELWG
jgi:alkaline phosphatase